MNPEQSETNREQAEVILYAPPIPNSVLALQALEEANIGVLVVPNRELHAVWAHSTFTGLGEIQDLAQRLHRVEETLRQAMQENPQLFGPLDSGREVRAQRKQLLAEAWAVMDSLQTAATSENE